MDTAPTQTKPNAPPSGQTDNPGNTEDVKSKPSKNQEPQNTANQDVKYAEVYFGTYEQDND